MKRVTVIFDIGKSNKKCFLFDENFDEVLRIYETFEETKDEDGFPCDDLKAIVNWIKRIAVQLMENPEYEITGINFSTYGASLVHIDHQRNVLTPLINYLKPYPPQIKDLFHEQYGSEEKIALETGSPPSGMLNAGFQLYWLKKTKPELFNQVKWSLHFPQYLSYLFTGIPFSDFTSIGCHTSLWDYKKKAYHQWVLSEGFDKILAPLVDTNSHSFLDFPNQGKIKIGIGIHDSSAALLPYLEANKKPFLLISTGTWSISLNPFSTEALSPEDLRKDGLNYMRIDGRPVRASRLFLGNEFKIQVKKIANFFKVDKHFYREVAFDPKVCEQLAKVAGPKFYFESIQADGATSRFTDFSAFKNPKIAYHQLMIDLVNVQIASAKRAIGKTNIQKIYIDGGFANNELFVQLIARHFQGIKIRKTDAAYGSALGAAVVLSDKKLNKRFLKKHYKMKKVKARK